jgi:hypothetical protein
MGRRKNPKKFSEKHNESPRIYYWERFWSAKYPEPPSTLGPFAYSMYSSLEPLEQVYIGKLKSAFDIWRDMLYTFPPAVPTTLLQRTFLSDDIQMCFSFEDNPMKYDIFFRFIFQREIDREEVLKEIDQLLADNAIPYTNFFEASCYFYIIATRHFSDDDFDLKEVQFFRAMFEAINALNKFICKHEAYLQEKNKQSHTAASRKGGENKWSKIRVEVTRLLKEEIGTGQGIGKFQDGATLTEHLCPKVKDYIRIHEVSSPEDLFTTIDNWSLSSKSDIAALYGLLVK